MGANTLPVSLDGSVAVPCWRGANYPAVIWAGNIHTAPEPFCEIYHAPSVTRLRDGVNA